MSVLPLLLQANSARGVSPAPPYAKLWRGGMSRLLEGSGTQQWESEGLLTGMAGGGMGLRPDSLDGHDV